MKAPKQTGPRLKAFTLVELLVVTAIIVILAALLMPVLSRGKEQAQSVSCENHLRQIGLAVEMYVSDHNVYPPGFGGESAFKLWPDHLAPYNPVPWTNASWQCPTYVAEGGTAMLQVFQQTGGNFAFKASCSYSYNSEGIIGYKLITTNNWATQSPPLGLGELNVKVPDDRIVAPSEMYTVGDTRPARYRDKGGLDGRMVMWPWKLLPSGLNARYTEAKPPHAEGYNLLFADGHVSLVKQKDYLYPPRTAQNWNRDHQPHPELWSPTNEWVIQN
jgi:prepilin-type processing-associated H-X9-DG protein/prepilin-type N-terminal cleavage/methylation domain-containing protein